MSSKHRQSSLEACVSVPGDGRDGAIVARLFGRIAPKVTKRVLRLLNCCTRRPCVHAQTQHIVAVARPTQQTLEGCRFSRKAQRWPRVCCEQRAAVVAWDKGILSCCATPDRHSASSKSDERQWTACACLHGQSSPRCMVIARRGSTIAAWGTGDMCVVVAKASNAWRTC